MGEMLKQFIAGLQQHDARPIIRKVARVLAGLFLLIIAVLLYAPALGDTRFVFGTDTVSHDYIMHYYGWAKSIGEHGELPLWNPYLFSGFPMIASAALCPFYPSQWLYFILPFNTAFTMQYVLALAVGGGAFNLFGSLLTGLLMFAVLYAFSRWATIADPRILRILFNSSKFRSRYDPAKMQ